MVRVWLVALVWLAAGCPGTSALPPRLDAGPDWWSPPFPDLMPAVDLWAGPKLDAGPSGDGGADAFLGDLSFPGQVLLVALDQAQTGNLGGVQGADGLCQTQAQAAGMPGTFRAFLSSSSQDVKDLVSGASAALPVVNTQGQVMFSSWAAVFSTQEWADNVELYNFAGAAVQDGTGGATDADAWHGSQPDGTVYAGKTCQDWTSASSSSEGANGELDQHELLRQETHNCDNTFAVVCVRLVP